MREKVIRQFTEDGTILAQLDHGYKTLHETILQACIAPIMKIIIALPLSMKSPLAHQGYNQQNYNLSQSQLRKRQTQ